mgnify:CR=1 FL=1
MTVDVTYVALMLTSIAVAAWLARGTQAALGLTVRQRVMVGLGAFTGAFLTAKLPFFLAADWPEILSGRALFSDGKTIMFGLVGGYIGVEIAKRMAGVTVGTGDTFAVPVAVAVAIGRVACFTHGCCHGIQTRLPWGVDFGDGVLRHPTQLYESAFHLACAAAVAVLKRDGLFRGQLFKLYLLLYCTYRFATEFIRPEPRGWGGLTGYQWVALALVPVFVLLWWRDARTGLSPANRIG